MGGLAGEFASSWAPHEVSWSEVYARGRVERGVCGIALNVHVMMLAQITEIPVQLLHALLMCLEAFALEAFVELWGIREKEGRGVS